MKKILLILSVCSLLFAQETDKKRLHFGLRLGGGIGLSAPSDWYRETFLFTDDWQAWVFLDEYDYYTWFRATYPASFAPKWHRGGGSFDFAPFISLQIVDNFAIQTEALFTRHSYINLDDVVITSFDFEKNEFVKIKEFNIRQSRPAIIFPLLAKLTFYPSKYSIQAFAGPHFTVNYGKFKSIEDGKVEKHSDGYIFFEKGLFPLIGITAGGSFGVKAGVGTLFFDARYFSDFWTNNWYEEPYVRRARLSLSVGYEFSAISR